MLKEVLHESCSESGLTRVVRDSNGNVRIDSYFGNERNLREHDSVILNADTGQFSVHGFDHKDKFDSNKSNGKTKIK